MSTAYSEVARFHGHECPGMTVGHPAVDIDIRSANFTVNRHDQLVRVDDGTRWRVMDILPDVDGRRRLILNGIA